MKFLTTLSLLSSLVFASDQFYLRISSDEGDIDGQFARPMDTGMGKQLMFVNSEYDQPFSMGPDGTLDYHMDGGVIWTGDLEFVNDNDKVQRALLIEREGTQGFYSIVDEKLYADGTNNWWACHTGIDPRVRSDLPVLYSYYEGNDGVDGCFRVELVRQWVDES